MVIVLNGNAISAWGAIYLPKTAIKTKIMIAIPKILNCAFFKLKPSEKAIYTTDPSVSFCTRGLTITQNTSTSRFTAR